MKKYMAPELSELFTLEDVLITSEDDNTTDDFVKDDDFGGESDNFEIPGTIAD